MTSKRQNLRILFGGGWVSDVGPSINVGANQNGDLTMPFLTTAQNIFYEPDGSPHKIPGMTKLNSAAVAGEVMGLFDYWKFGVAGVGVNKRICHASTIGYGDAANGTFSSLDTGLTDHAVPCYTEFNGSVIISTTASAAGANAPQAYDQSTWAALGGSPPYFQFSCVHRQRLWAAGVDSTPNTLHYSSYLNEAQWNGAGTSGTLTIPASGDDGDRITGLMAVGNDLYVFRGPYYGSVYVVSGSSNTGADAFTVSPNPVVRGVSAVWHNSIFRFRNDVGFMWSDGHIYSLANAKNYGGYGESALSRPIHSYLDANINLAELKKVTVAVNEQRSYAVIAIPTGSATFSKNLLWMDYSRENVWWAEIPGFTGKCSCVARVVDSADSNKVKIYVGGEDGFVRKMDAADRSIDTNIAYTAKATTPYTNLGSALLTKTISNIGACVVPKGNYSLTLGWKRDKQTQQTATLAQVSTSTAWPFVDIFNEAEEGGEFKSIQFEVSDAVVSQDMEVHSISASIEVNGIDTAPLPVAGA